MVIDKHNIWRVKMMLVFVYSAGCTSLFGTFATCAVKVGSNDTCALHKKAQLVTSSCKNETAVVLLPWDVFA